MRRWAWWLVRSRVARVRCAGAQALGASTGCGLHVRARARLGGCAGPRSRKVGRLCRSTLAQGWEALPGHTFGPRERGHRMLALDWACTCTLAQGSWWVGMQNAGPWLLQGGSKRAHASNRWPCLPSCGRAGWPMRLGLGDGLGVCDRYGMVAGAVLPAFVLRPTRRSFAQADMPKNLQVLQWCGQTPFYCARERSNVRVSQDCAFCSACSR